jgi:hypothetical protein
MLVPDTSIDQPHPTLASSARVTTRTHPVMLVPDTGIASHPG